MDQRKEIKVIIEQVIRFILYYTLKCLWRHVLLQSSARHLVVEATPLCT